MNKVVLNKAPYYVPDHIIEKLADILTAEEVHEIITALSIVKGRELTITLPDHIKKMEFPMEFPISFDECEKVIGIVEELTLEDDLLELLMLSEHVSYTEFKKVLYSITPETEVTKRLNSIFLDTIKERKEDKTTERLFYTLRDRLLDYFTEMEVIDGLMNIRSYFEAEIRAFIETLDPENFYMDEFDEETKEVRMKRILLDFINIIGRRFKNTL